MAHTKSSRLASLAWSCLSTGSTSGLPFSCSVNVQEHPMRPSFWPFRPQVAWIVFTGHMSLESTMTIWSIMRHSFPAGFCYLHVGYNYRHHWNRRSADTLDCRWNRPSESVTCSRSQQPEVTAGMVAGAGPAGLFWHCNCNSQKVVTLNQFYWIEVEQRGRDIDLEP